MLGDRDLSDAGVEILSDDVLLLLGFLQGEGQVRKEWVTYIPWLHPSSKRLKLQILPSKKDQLLLLLR